MQLLLFSRFHPAPQKDLNKLGHAGRFFPKRTGSQGGHLLTQGETFLSCKYPLKQGGLPAAFKAGGGGLAKVSLNQRFWCALFSSRLGQGQGDLVLTTVAFFNPTFPIAHHFKETVPERSKPHCEPSCQVQNNIPKEVSLKPVTILSLPLSRKYCLIPPKFPK